MITTGRVTLEKSRMIDLTSWLNTYFGRRPKSFEIGPYAFNEDYMLVDHDGLVFGNRFGIGFYRDRSKTISVSLTMTANKSSMQLC